MEEQDFKKEDLIFFYELIVKVAKKIYLKKITICDDVYFDIEKEVIVNKKFNDDKNHTSIKLLDSDMVFAITNKIYKELVVEKMIRFLKLELLSREDDFNGITSCLMKASIENYNPIYFTYTYGKNSLGLDPADVRIYTFLNLYKGEPGFFIDFDYVTLSIKDLLIILFVSLFLEVKSFDMMRYTKILDENYYPKANNLED